MISNKWVAVNAGDTLFAQLIKIINTYANIVISYIHNIHMYTISGRLLCIEYI